MRRVARLIGFLAVCLFFLISMAAARPFLLLAPQPKRMRLVAESVRLWARACLRILRLKINAHGFSDGLRSNRRLLVCNHQSYLDVVIIASIFPTLFVAKTEVSRWPLFGWLSELGGTIFVNREDARSGVKCAYHVSRMLREGVNIQVFPEASTSDGATVMPFKGLFFASAVRSRAPVLPLTIRFQSVNGRPIEREELDLLCWYGEMDFAPHFWKLLNIESAEISLMINEPIKPVRAQRARDLARVARERILRSFTNADAIAAARAEVPVEFARAEDHSQSDGQTGIETATAADYIIGAMLFSHFSTGVSDTIREATSQSENE
jgi:lyso-ornithine lipid O-acyltransferase